MSSSPVHDASRTDPADATAGPPGTAVPADEAVSADGVPAAGEQPPSDGVPPRLDDVVDLGSWAAFEPSLAALLDGRARPAPDWPGLTVLLTAPRPVVTQADLEQRMGLRSLLRGRRKRVPSPEVPGLVVVGRGDGVEVGVPVLDAEGRHLLGPDTREALGRLGWAQHEDVMVRLLPDGAGAAQAVARVLIEMLRVAHPADLDHLVALTG
ncbi:MULTISPECIES: hypothetical protein [unclassified Actinomyces]|uniref:hypothetical protein n=1 Tax=unclassified Actinomyces TaxID=2609248 RepID=UPI0020182C0A|nr:MULTISPECIES: hypothetical protein [unclassified Actinomyces]